MADYSLRKAKPDDIAFLMAAERQPGYDRLVSSSSAEDHAAEMAKPNSAVLLALRDNAPVGFVILQNLDNPYQNIYIKRVVVAQSGQGHGSFMMMLATRHAFTTLGAHRLWLTTLPKNQRARALYRKIGFVEEGVQRGAYRNVDGHYCDVIQMSLLKPDWHFLQSHA